MVKHLHITMDDSEHERIAGLKDQEGLTWAEFLSEASDAFEKQRS